MKKYLSLLAIGLFFLVGCSSTRANISPEYKAEAVRSLAILPVEYPAEVQREKVDALRNALESELRNSGFEVIADRIVRMTCTSPACPERSILATKYLVDGFVKVEVRSVERANFLAGFVNTIGGKITITDKNNVQLVSVDQSENERGGLLFNSGQVVQGIISSVENTEEASFNRLSVKFAQGLVSKIPRPNVPQVNKDATSVSIVDVSVKQIRPQIFEVCAEATPNSLVSVVINRQRSNLREVSEAHFCGAFLLDSSINSSTLLKVEARSPFGGAVRKEVPVGSDIEVCSLDGNVVLTSTKGKSQVELNCIDFNNGKGPILGNCAEKVKSCPDNKLLVFRSTSPTGPYEKVAEVKSTSWIDAKSQPGSTTQYELVSVNKAGLWSLPVAAKPNS